MEKINGIFTSRTRLLHTIKPEIDMSDQLSILTLE